MKNPEQYASELLASYEGDRDVAYNAFVAGMAEARPVGCTHIWCMAVVRAIYRQD